MDKEQIDRIFEAVKNEDYDTLFAISGLQISFEEFESKSEEEKGTIADDIQRTIMSQIEDGDFEYFKSKLKNDEDAEIAIFFLDFIKNKERIIELLQDTEIGFDTKNLLRLINRIDEDNSDHSYAKDVIEGRVKIGTELDDELVYNLLQTINDIEYTKRILRQNSELITKFSPYEIEKLGDNELTMMYLRIAMDHVDDKNKRVIIDLIESTGDTQLIRKTIDGSAGLTLDEYEMTRLLLKLGDDELIKECIEGRSQNRSKTW